MQMLHSAALLTGHFGTPMQLVLLINIKTKKMKRNKLSIWGALLSLLIVATACVDFVEPNIPYKDFDTGAYLRTIERTSVTFSSANLASSNFALTLEAVDAEDGRTVESVEVRVRHRRVIPDVSVDFTPAAGSDDIVIRTFSQDDFSPNDESRFLRMSFSIPASEAISAVGFTEDDIEINDVFEFRLVLTDTQGRVFTNTNRSSDVAGGFFYDSPFFYTVDVVE